MPVIRLLFISILSCLGVIFGSGILKKALSISLCGLLGFNSIGCIPFWSDESRVNATLVTTKSESTISNMLKVKVPKVIGEIPKLRKAELDLPNDFQVVSQMPFSSGKREIVMVSFSTETEVVYTTTLAGVEDFQLFSLEFKTRGIDLRPLFVRNNIQGDTNEIESLLKKFKIFFKDSSVSEIVFADESSIEFNGNEAIIKSPKGKVLEKIQLLIKNNINQSTKNIQLINKSTESKEVFNYGLLAKKKSNYEIAINTYLSKLANNISSQVEQLITSNASVYNSIINAAKNAIIAASQGIVELGENRTAATTLSQFPVKCNEKVVSRGSEIRTDLLEISQDSNPKEVTIKYDFFDIPDKIEAFYDGQKLFTIGTKTGSGSEKYKLPSTVKQVVIKVTGNQQDKSTKWNYKVSCSSQPESTVETQIIDPYPALLEADRLYLLGKKLEAEKIYRQVKKPFSTQTNIVIIKEPITDPQKLSIAGKVYWRHAQEGIQENLEIKTLASLELLTEKQPEFIPAYQLLAEALQKKEQYKEALNVLEKGVTLFPESVELTKSLIKGLESEDKWLEASITARQFAVVYPQHPDSPKLLHIADDNLRLFNDSLNKKIISTGILSGIAGILTGNGINTTFELAPLMLQGESAMGSRLAKSHKKRLRLIKDPVVLDYVNTIGQDLAKLMGRNFQYEFYVVQDYSPDTFSFPGGKIFVNTGTILASNSEAQLAGIIAHEISHSVLSHGFEKIVSNRLLNNLRKNIPLRDLVSKIALSEYTQQQQQQSDILGTRALASAGYAADGLRNFVFKLEEKPDSNDFDIYNVPNLGSLVTNPPISKRISYLEQLVMRNGYNRYSYEGVKKHAAMQKRLR
jgi:tetratricopeptide (TPR) repeat protein